MRFDGHFSLLSPTGASLNIHAKSAKRRAVGVIQVNHGMAEHAGRYGRFATAAADRGFHVYAHDHRGHGATTAPDAPARSFASRDGAARVVADILAVHEYIGTEHPGLPVTCFGHSMGSNLALAFALDHPERIAALALWNSDYAPGLVGRLARGLLAIERFRLGSDVPSPLMAQLTFRAWGRSIADRRTDFDWLSRDADEVAKYIRDPLCGWDASVGMWLDVIEMAFRDAKPPRLARMRRDLPVHLAGGTGDPVTKGGETVRRQAERLRALGFSRITSRLFKDARHESLNEIGRDAITADFLDWAQSVTS